MNSAYIAALAFALQSAAILAHYGVSLTMDGPMWVWFMFMFFAVSLAILGDLTSNAAREAKP